MLDQESTAHASELDLVSGGVDLVPTNQDSEAAGAAKPATPRGSTPGAIGVNGSNEPIAPNLIAIGLV